MKRYSFLEAWQKDGQKHLFPVDPKTPLNERPYMQRQGGVWDNRDLKGMQAKGQAAAQKYTEVDKKYEELEKKGLLVSNPWAKDWSDKKIAENASSGNKQTAKPAASVKPAAKEEEAPKKKGFFGLF